MSAAQVHAFKNAFESVPTEVYEQIQSAKKLPVKPKTFRLILIELEHRYGTDLSEIKCRLKPSVALLHHVRYKPDFSGYDYSKHILSGILLSEKLHTRARLELAEFYGV